jgi:hypothetical protein
MLFNNIFAGHILFEQRHRSTFLSDVYAKIYFWPFSTIIVFPLVLVMNSIFIIQMI